MNLHTTLRDATWLNESLEVLYQTRLKGNPRPWRETDTAHTDDTPKPRHTPTTQQGWWKAFNATPHLSHTEPLGEHPTPLHLDVIDLITDITNSARHLAIQIAHLHGDTPVLAHLSRPKAKPHDHLTYITHRLIDHPDLEGFTEPLHQARIKAARHFQEVVVGQRLKTPCPWCDKPQLFFRSIGPEHSPEVVVRCDSGACNPPSADCGTYHKGRPCWLFHEWEWLAERIDYANATKTQKRHAKPNKVAKLSTSR